MKRPRIKTALTASLLAIAVTVGLFAAYAVNRNGAINRTFSEMAEVWVPSLELAKDIEVKVGNIRTAYRSHILRDDVEGKQAAAASISDAMAAFENDLEQLRKLAVIDAQLTILQSVGESVDAYVTKGEDVLRFSAQGQVKQANDLLRNEMVVFAKEAEASVAELLKINKAAVTEAKAASEQLYTSTVSVSIAVISGLALIIAAAIYFALRQVARPIQQITLSMKRLADGDKDSAIPFAGRADEIGEMAAAVSVFRENALANDRLESEAAQQRSRSKAEQARIAAADKNRAEEMAEATAGLAAGLKRLAAADLSFQLDQPFAPEFESLRSDYNAAVLQLAETLSTVKQATAQIDSGTKEISKSADDLSKRTEQQAASLEETAAALDQITANVSNSSQRTQEARNVAIDARESAGQSASVVARAVEAMQRIEKSSNEINNIIVVIDEIAFQTNLLALNAGVEAARAGEAGKGFAVVAQEVRELAQRSARAAKEIKDLIRNSGGEVTNGVKLVSETGAALRKIEEHIAVINQHMEAIALSAREQSVGLSEVNTAVNQMDQVTQQNAAMVEESNAASATLAAEAARLKDLIGRFAINDGAATATGQVAALRRAASSMSAPRSSGTIAATRGNLAVKAQQWDEF
jgi:methyl-accepting chemotaxis protein